MKALLSLILYNRNETLWERDSGIKFYLATDGNSVERLGYINYKTDLKLNI